VSMSLDIDRENNVAYLSFIERDPEQQHDIVERSVPLAILDDGLCWDGHEAEVVVDFDKDGGIVGIELLNARTQLGVLWDRAIDPLS
jgi:uncharacterized protein YuzE